MSKEIRNKKTPRRGSGQARKQTGQLASWPTGFTLIEMIIYLAIVGVMLVSISYLILDIMSGQTKNYARQAINQNLLTMTDILAKDIHSSQDIVSLNDQTIVLNQSGTNITYNFDQADKKLTRQVGSGEPLGLNADQVEVNGNFYNLSYLMRSKNIGIHLELNYKNPGNLPDYNASSTADLSVELRGRR